jgi:hypothetical protein
MMAVLVYTVFLFGLPGERESERYTIPDPEQPRKERTGRLSAKDAESLQGGNQKARRDKAGKGTEGTQTQGTPKRTGKGEQKGNTRKHNKRRSS